MNQTKAKQWALSIFARGFELTMSNSFGKGMYFEGKHEPLKRRELTWGIPINHGANAIVWFYATRPESPD